MKTTMTALAVVFLALAGPALAQPGDGQRGPRDWSGQRDGGGRFQRDGDGRRDRSQARDAPAAVQAPTAPQAAEPRPAPAPREGRGADGGGNPWMGRGVLRDRVERERGDRDGDRDRPAVARRDDGRRDDGRRDGGRRDGGAWTERDRRGDDARQWDRRPSDRRQWDRRDDGRRDDRRWERGRYPSVYFSSQRYRHAWRPPPGFYVRTWGYGDVLPRGWYGPGWWLGDPWRYDLPLPPPGYEWVRAGDDALLVDRFDGRVVQVVRDVFW